MKLFKSSGVEVGFKKWLGPRPQKTVNIPARDWKFWLGIVLTIGWFILLMFIVVRSTYVPTVNQWWKVQSEKERTRLGTARAPEASGPQSPSLKLAFPKTGDYYKVGFDVLSGFLSESPLLDSVRVDPRAKSRKPEAKVPDKIMALNGQKVSVPGFMIPMLTEKDNVLTFILAQNQMTCCYGVAPKLNQWIYVTMGEGRTADWVMDTPLTIYGTLSVGEQYDKQNKDWCLYRMTADKVERPKKSWF